MTNFKWVGARQTVYSLTVLELVPMTVMTFSTSSNVIDSPHMETLSHGLVELGAHILASLGISRLACDQLRLKQHGGFHHAKTGSPLIGLEPKPRYCMIKSASCLYRFGNTAKTLPWQNSRLSTANLSHVLESLELECGHLGSFDHGRYASRKSPW